MQLSLPGTSWPTWVVGITRVKPLSPDLLNLYVCDKSDIFDPSGGIIEKKAGIKLWDTVDIPIPNGRQLLALVTVFNKSDLSFPAFNSESVGEHLSHFSQK
jgi:hypothetical protein